MADTSKNFDIEIHGRGENASTFADNPDDQIADIDFTPPASDGISLEPGHERVRFVAPVWLRGENDEEDREGVVINLSMQGLACAVSCQLNSGERIWARLRLALASEPLKLFCEVLWKRPAQNATFIYGLRFLSLTDDERQGLACIIDERVHGRAAEWPLPVMPESRDRVQPTRPTRLPAMGVAAGMVFLIGAGVWLLVAPGSRAATGITSGHGMSTSRKIVAADARAEPPTPQTAPIISAPVTGVPSAATEATPASPPPAPDSATAEKDSVTAATTTKSPAAAKPSPASPTAKTLPRRGSPSTVSPSDEFLRPLGTRHSVEIALLTDGPVDEHSEFWLENPARLVVDVPHRKSGFAKLSYVVQNPLITKVRVGEHSDKVRFVIEASRGVSPEFKVQPRGNSLLIQFKHR